MSLRSKDGLASSLPHHPSKNTSKSISGPQPAMAQQPPAPAEAENTPEGWARIEAEWYRDRQRARDLEDSSMADKYERRMAPLRENHTRLLDERQRLHEMLLAVKKQCDEADDEINRMDLHYFEAKDIVAKRRQQQDENAILFFTRNKNEALRLAGRANEMVPEVVPVAKQLSSSGSDTPHNKAANGTSQVGTPGSDDTAVDDPVRNGHAAIQSSGPASAESSPLSLPPDDEAEWTGAEIQTHDGQLITRVKRIKLENRYVRNILQVPIQRPVKVRPGRKFGQETVDSIYEPSDTKGAKWISCMIQATGEEQDVACTSCQSRAGTWAGCVIVGGDDFPRCANCEWNRQGCAGSSYHHCRSQDPDLQSAPGDQAPISPMPPSVQHSGETSREGSFGGFTPVNGAQPRTALPTSVPSSAPPKRTSLPTKKGGRKSLPNMASSGKQNLQVRDDTAAAGPDAEAAAEASEDGAEVDPGPDITKESLHLQHNGVVYTAPEIMRGVPVERISSSHPYWDEKWEEVRPALDAKLSDWQNKLNICLTTGKNRFLAGRQVNRGKTIMKFIDTADFHPYQLVSKKFITKSLVSYDTIFRLAQVIEELPKVHAKLGITDITPLDWVRERMHELYVEQGDAFSLSRTVHELYHDPKLRALRTRAGFGNIGRPSGVKKGMTSKGGAIRLKDLDDTPMSTPQKLSRPSSSGSTKSGHSLMQESKRDFLEDGMTPSPRSIKKQRVDTGNLPTPDG